MHWLYGNFYGIMKFKQPAQCYPNLCLLLDQIFIESVPQANAKSSGYITTSVYATHISFTCTYIWLKIFTILFQFPILFFYSLHWRRHSHPSGYNVFAYMHNSATPFQPFGEVFLFVLLLLLLRALFNIHFDCYSI